MNIEPMTAAEYGDWCNVGLGVNTDRVIAALEERERLLGRVAVLTDERGRARHEAAEVRRLCETDAALGALVRRIREHEKRPTCVYVSADTIWKMFPLDHDGLTEFADYLDSLLPKEPEVVTVASTREYRLKGGAVEWVQPGWGGKVWVKAHNIPIEDAPVVAKLMENSTHD